ncbi:MAG: helix-turn-helix transcriptional regulator [Deltaproteobacteria bacterium]|nr:helix-turn-helix transcriptional regulator [Deltaproteobacteria bacterium]
MSKKITSSWKNIKKELLKDPAILNEYERLEPDYQIIREIIKARIKQGLSQKELAERIGTRQSNISRLESGDCNPSLEFLIKVAHGLDKELSILLR